MVFPLQSQQEANRHDERQRFRRRSCPPETVHIQRHRQQDDRRRLKHQRAQERNCRGHAAVVQRREEGGQEDVEAREQEGEGEEVKGVPRLFAERRVIADEDVCQRPGQRDGGDCHHDA